MHESCANVQKNGWLKKGSKELAEAEKGSLGPNKDCRGSLKLQIFSEQNVCHEIFGDQKVSLGFTRAHQGLLGIINLC